MTNNKILKEERISKRKEVRRSMKKGIDFLTILFIVMAGFFFYNHNNIGWVFLLLGILKYFVDKD